MRRLLFLACTLVAVAAFGGRIDVARRHLDPPGRADCPAPWCEQLPAIHRLEAPDDPSMYLGDVISYERPSDWRHFAPMVDQVEALTQPLNSDQDRVVAIADWVKHSKVSAPHAYTTWPPSIIDIWGFREGQCEEASFLLVAMLRLAGIPAMRFLTWNDAHAAVRAYVDEAWEVVDATPTTPDNSGPARIYEPGDPAVLPAFQERPLMVLSDVAVPGTDTQVATFTLLSEEPIDASEALSRIGLEYGKVAFPVTNEFLYYDRTRRVFVDDGQPAQRITVRFRIEPIDASCLTDRRVLYAGPVASVTPGPFWRTADPPLPPQIGLFYPTGYIDTILPACGAWRIVYYLSAEDLDAPSLTLAYEEFNLDSATGPVVIRPDQLQPAPGADMYVFRTLVDALDRVPSFEQLGGGFVQ